MVIVLSLFGDIFQCGSLFTLVSHGQCCLHVGSTSSMLLYSSPLCLGKKDFSDCLQIPNDLDAIFKKKLKGIFSVSNFHL